MPDKPLRQAIGDHAQQQNPPRGPANVVQGPRVYIQKNVQKKVQTKQNPPQEEWAQR